MRAAASIRFRTSAIWSSPKPTAPASCDHQHRRLSELIADGTESDLPPLLKANQPAHKRHNLTALLIILKCVEGT